MEEYHNCCGQSSFALEFNGPPLQHDLRVRKDKGKDGKAPFTLAASCCIGRRLEARPGS